MCLADVNFLTCSTAGCATDTPFLVKQTALASNLVTESGALAVVIIEPLLPIVTRRHSHACKEESNKVFTKSFMMMTLFINQSSGFIVCFTNVVYEYSNKL